ncbi:MAG TPA: hypothetical protein VFN02_03245 [Ktedonobacteraceae bacterium]|jgi:hypothetical protein|nr:hypothetical protein [Ktedonobacteraceae bacterium]
MILHLGERVYWGAPEVIYLEGAITRLDEATQSVVVHIDRATPNSAHLIGSEIAFFADGLAPLEGDSPPGISDKHSEEHQPAPKMTDTEKVRSAAAVAVHQQYGYTLPAEQEQMLIDQVAKAINNDLAMRTRVIASMDEILSREM